MDTLRLFCDVARHRSFSKAAAEHRITQSAASQRVSALEKQLGVTLLDRSVRPPALTDAGQEFLRGCADLLQRYDQLEARVAGMRRRYEPTPIHVDAIYSAGIDLLQQIQESFLQWVPGAEVVVEYKRPEQVHEAVRQRRCDLGIVSYPSRWRDVGVIPLRDETMAVVCAPTHPLSLKPMIRARELTGWTMVNFEPSLPVGRAILRYLREHGASPRIVNVFDNIDTIKNALTVTDEFAILPRRTVAREAASGTLAAVTLEPALHRPLGIIHARQGGASMRPEVRAFVDYMLRHAGPDCDLVAKAQAAALSTPASAPVSTPVPAPLSTR